jgi:hypothetical protein
MKAFAARPRDAEDIRQLAEAAEGILDACPVEQRRGISHAASIS